MIAAGFLAVLAGAVIMAASLRRGRDSVGDLDEVLDLRALLPDLDDNGGRPDPSPAVVTTAVDLAARMVERLDPRGGLAARLEQARIPLRPGEYLIITAAAALALAALFLSLTGERIMGVGGGLLGAGASAVLLRVRISRRRKAFEEQLPDALALIASSLAAGHTFLRSMQMMCEESRPPLSEEFGRVVGETQLGTPVADALQHMADRLGVRDFDWVVQAIRIQQTVGGRLADLLHTLADFIRARTEVRREVKVLTAEGRISAWVLSGIPPLLLLALQTMNPDYVSALYQGAGLIILTASGASVAVGTVLILRMVKIKV